MVLKYASLAYTFALLVQCHFFQSFCQTLREQSESILYPLLNLGFAQKHDVICTRGGIFCTRMVLFAVAKCIKNGDMCSRVCILHKLRAKDNQNAGRSVRYALVRAHLQCTLGCGAVWHPVKTHLSVRLGSSCPPVPSNFLARLVCCAFFFVGMGSGPLFSLLPLLLFFLSRPPLTMGRGCGALLAGCSSFLPRKIDVFSLVTTQWRFFL